MIWRCVICCVFVTLTLKSLLSHINLAHSHSPDFRVKCGIDGCTKEYRVYNSFWYHIKRTHSQHLLRTTWSSCTDRQTHGGTDRRLQSCKGSRGTRRTRTVDHFGNFDTGLSVYIGFNSEGTTSDPAPADTTAEIPTELLAGVAGPESAPSVLLTENGHENTGVSSRLLKVQVKHIFISVFKTILGQIMIKKTTLAVNLLPCQSPLDENA